MWYLESLVSIPGWLSREGTEQLVGHGRRGEKSATKEQGHLPWTPHSDSLLSSLQSLAGGSPMLSPVKRQRARAPLDALRRSASGAQSRGEDGALGGEAAGGRPGSSTSGHQVLQCPCCPWGPFSPRAWKSCQGRRARWVPKS